MTLGQFRKLTQKLDDDVRLVVQGTTPNDSQEYYDVALLLSAPELSCGDVKSKSVIVRTIRCEPRLSKLEALGDK